LDRLPQEVWSEGPVAWLEQRWWFALGALAITAALLIGAYLYGLPVLAERVASHVPIETERVLGDQTLTWLDTRQWFLPTTLAADVQNRIRDGFAMLVAGLPVERNCRLEFRAAHILGANAFALPGGTIVITDAMVEATISQEEVLAILAHEVGHVELRHTLRMLLQGSAVGVAAAAITGDAASLSGAMTGLPYLMVETSYSRQFETQADDFAFRLLKQRAISPAAFADIMERLRAKDDTERPFAFLATHPLTAERVRRARAAALP
jgi:predicted Zn-dependent protease